MREKVLLDIFQAGLERGIGQQFTPHLYKSADDIHAHGYRAFAVKDAGRHDRSMLGKCPWKVLSMLSPTAL